MLPDTSFGNAGVSLGPAKLRGPDCDPVTVARPLRYGSRLALCPAHSPPEQLLAPRPVADNGARTQELSHRPGTGAVMEETVVVSQEPSP